MRTGPRLERGLVLTGRYELVEPIGAGGMGEVWRGVDLRLRRPVAIKILPAEVDAVQAAVTRFRREAETTAGLQHPGITVMFDIDEHPHQGGRLAFLVMELLTGQNLREVLLERPGGLPVEHAASVAAQVADALAAAHASGVIHRDIKPANLFLQGDGRVKICDFGIARLAGAGTKLTATGGLVGTPLYMAPEQFRGEALDARADLYSLGCVLHEMLVGVPPFTADTAPVIMYRHLTETPAPPRSSRPEVPERLDRLTMDLLAKEPSERPPSAAAVAAFLRESGLGAGPAWPGPAAVTASTDTPPPNAPPTVPAVTARPPKPRRRRPLMIAAVAFAAVVALAGGAFAALSQSRGGGPPRPAASSPGGAGTAAPVRSNPNPVVPGWQVMLAPGYGVAYDVPPGWKLEEPGTFSGFEDNDGNLLAGERAVATVKRGRCVRAQAGLRGGSDPKARPTTDELDALAGAADQEARKWAAAAYGAADQRPHPPKIDARPSDTVTTHGITAARVAVNVTTTAREDGCTPSHATVETLAMAATRNASTVGPLIFIVFADRNVPGQVPGGVLRQIAGSIRPYTCPPGTRTHGDNKCSAAASPSN